jgi:hypothetical protein
VPLTQAAMFEALSIVAQARTAAIMDLGISLIDGRRLTGTGTDCIVVTSPAGPHALNHCGLHTALGRLIGETTEIFYKDWGPKGQPIVFHHGWPLSADDWDARCCSSWPGLSRHRP